LTTKRVSTLVSDHKQKAGYNLASWVKVGGTDQVGKSGIRCGGIAGRAKPRKRMHWVGRRGRCARRGAPKRERDKLHSKGGVEQEHEAKHTGGERGFGERRDGENVTGEGCISTGDNGKIEGKVLDSTKDRKDVHGDNPDKRSETVRQTSPWIK